MNELILQAYFLNRNLNALEKLFIVAILLISVDGFPLLPLNSDNRPISTFILIAYWLWHKTLTRELDVYESWMWGILAVLIGFTFYRGAFQYHDYKGAIKFLITGTLGVITISTCLTFMRGLLDRFSIDDTLRIITYALILSTILPIIVGLIQFVALMGVVPKGIGEVVTNIFSYRPLLTRMQMISTEPAHAAAYLLFVLLWVYAFYRDDIVFRNVFIAILFVVFFLINSSVGYISFVLTVFFYWLLCLKKDLQKTFIYIFSTVLVGGLVFLIGRYFIVGYTANKLGMVTDLVTSMNMDLLLFTFTIDYSLLDRFGTPVLGVLSLKDTNYLGTGGESFYYIFPDLIKVYFPEMMYNKMLVQRMELDAHFTVKFLPAKIATEFGILGLSGFVYFVVKQFRNINFIQKNYDSPVFAGLCLCFIYTIISTYMCSYFHFIVILAFVITYTVYEYGKGNFFLNDFNNNSSL